MKWMKPIGIVLALAAVCSPRLGAQVRVPAEGRPPETLGPPGEAVDLVIALDISDSMEPLIEAARLKLWEIVNAVAFADPPPHLRVALVTFGSHANDAARGWVRVETDLTGDLDLVAERLFGLNTGGGREYVARVVQTAVDELSWSPSWDVPKLMFVVGNEPADQDPDVNLSLAGDSAVDKGVVVNTLFCGSENQPDAAMWKVLAEQSDGVFSAIDPRSGLGATATPFDDELARLSREINRTFVPLGAAGQQRLASVVAQDDNAAQLGSATAAGRARTKALPGFSVGWDLVSTLQSGSIELEDVESSDLPDALQRRSIADLETFLEDIRDRRLKLQQRINELSVLRRQHIVEEIAAGAAESSKGFENTVHEVLRKNLEQRGFQLNE